VADRAGNFERVQSTEGAYGSKRFASISGTNCITTDEHGRATVLDTTCNSGIDIEEAASDEKYIALEPDRIPTIPSEEAISAVSNFNHASRGTRAKDLKRRSQYASEDLRRMEYDAIRCEEGCTSVVIVGSEFGPSKEADRLLRRRSGAKVVLPDAGKGLRLTPAVTASVVLFEIKRQFDVKNRDLGNSAES